MFSAIASGLRVFAGFGLSAILCVCSAVTVWVLFHFMDYLWPRPVFVFLWFSGIGLGAGIGTAIAWQATEVAPRLRSFHTLLWLAIGLAAVWAAYYFKTVVNPNPALFTSREITATAIVWAILAPNLIATGFGLFRQWRTGWL